MKDKLFSLIAGAAILGLAGVANAEDRSHQTPIQLTNAQLDGVTAGATAIGVGLGAAFGTLFSGVAIGIDTAVLGHNAAAVASVTSASASFTPGPGAAAASALSILLTSP